jgi:hypothetical protein
MLAAKRNADDGCAKHKTTDAITKGTKQSTKEKPDYIAEKVHKAKTLV